MILVPYQYDARAIAGESHGLQVHFSNQRASGVDYMQLAFLGLLADGRRDSMRAEDGAAADGHFIELFDEDRSGIAQFIDDVFVVDDFLAHVDRRTIEIEGNFHHVDRPHYARAKASRLKQEYLLTGP